MDFNSFAMNKSIDGQAIYPDPTQQDSVAVVVVVVVILCVLPKTGCPHAGLFCLQTRTTHACDITWNGQGRAAVMEGNAVRQVDKCKGQTQRWQHRASATNLVQVAVSSDTVYPRAFPFGRCVPHLPVRWPSTTRFRRGSAHRRAPHAQHPNRIHIHQTTTPSSATHARLLFKASSDRRQPPCLALNVR